RDSKHDPEPTAITTASRFARRERGAISSGAFRGEFAARCARWRAGAIAGSGFLTTFTVAVAATVASIVIVAAALVITIERRAITPPPVAEAARPAATFAVLAHLVFHVEPLEGAVHLVSRHRKQLVL